MEFETPFLRVKVSSLTILALLFLYLVDQDFAYRARQVVLTAEDVIQSSYFALWTRFHQLWFADPLSSVFRWIFAPFL
jgi:hypothetical protein